MPRLNLIQWDYKTKWNVPIGADINIPCPYNRTRMIGYLFHVNTGSDTPWSLNWYPTDGSFPDGRFTTALEAIRYMQELQRNGTFDRVLIYA